MVIGHFDESSGSAINDSGISGSNGTMTGASWCDGKYGDGSLFNGVNSSVVIKNSTNFQTQNEITLSAWIKPCLSQMDYIIGKAPAYVLRLMPAGQVVFLLGNKVVHGKSANLYLMLFKTTHGHMLLQFTMAQIWLIYVNGKVSGYPLAISGPMDLTNRTLQIGYDSWFLE